MTYYLAKPLDTKGWRYSLSKWEDGAIHPESTYVVTLGSYCDCPSPKRPCKHDGILREMLQHASDEGFRLYELYWEDGKVLNTNDLGFNIGENRP